jgi:hypothetical protein
MIVNGYLPNIHLHDEIKPPMADMIAANPAPQYVIHLAIAHHVVTRTPKNFRTVLCLVFLATIIAGLWQYL